MSRNLIIPPLFPSLLLLLLPSQASMVVYTDHVHPPADVTGDTCMVWLDAPDQLQQSLFGSLTQTPKKLNARHRR